MHLSNFLFHCIAVDRFPCVERDRVDSTSDGSNASRGRSTSVAPGKLQEHSHTREVIFALPSLQLHLKTEHLQTARTPDVIGMYIKRYRFFKRSLYNCLNICLRNIDCLFLYKSNYNIL